MTSNELEIDRAVFGYAEAYAKLWELVQKNPRNFPCGVISGGSIAEHYTKMYLKTLHKNAAVEYGRANERSWDIEVLASGKPSIKYQVKSVSVFNKKRIITGLIKGFDRPIVLSLDGNYFPTNVYLFEDATVFLAPEKINTLTVPADLPPKKRLPRVT